MWVVENEVFNHVVKHSLVGLCAKFDVNVSTISKLLPVTRQGEGMIFIIVFVF